MALSSHSWERITPRAVCSESFLLETEPLGGAIDMGGRGEDARSWWWQDDEAEKFIE